MPSRSINPWRLNFAALPIETLLRSLSNRWVPEALCHRTAGGEFTMRHLFSLTAISIFLTTNAFADQVRATWYGNEHRGHKTASGQVFNPEGLTAAHKSLPFGTCLVVENPRSGKSVHVTVNDRGPFAPGVTLDISWGAARAIGMRSTQSVTMRRC